MPNPNEKLSVYVRDDTATLRWDALKSDAIYSVLLSTNGGATVSVMADNVSGLTYTLSRLSCGAAYTAYIGYDAAGEKSTSSAMDFSLETSYCGGVTPPDPENTNVMIKVESPDAPIRHQHKTVVIGDKMYMFGGTSDKNLVTPNQEMWVYDSTANTWTKLNPAGTPPANRSAHTMEVINGKIYVFGGISSGGSSIGYDMQMFDPAQGSDGTWFALLTTDKPSFPAKYMAPVLYKNKMYVFGGGLLYVFDPQGGVYGKWTKLDKPMPPLLTYFLNVGVINDSIYIVDNYDGSTVDGLWRYTPNSSSYRKTNPANPLQGISSSGVTVYNNKMYLFGGNSSATTFEKDLWVFNPADGVEGRWEKITPKGDVPLEGYAGSTANVIGDKIYIFGGSNGTKALNDMYIYKP